MLIFAFQTVNKHFKENFHQKNCILYSYNPFHSSKKIILALLHTKHFIKSQIFRVSYQDSILLENKQNSYHHLLSKNTLLITQKTILQEPCFSKLIFNIFSVLEHVKLCRYYFQISFIFLRVQLAAGWCTDTDHCISLWSNTIINRHDYKACLIGAKIRCNIYITNIIISHFLQIDRQQKMKSR